MSPEPFSGFHYLDDVLACDGVSLETIVKEIGTPAYVYSGNLVTERYRALDAALGTYPHTLHYALKANSTLALLRLLRSLGASADANSANEIEVALRAGFIPAQIVFTGVGKTRSELERAIALELKAINVESSGELGRIAEIARRQGTRARVAVRVNPDVDALSHPHISTGLRRNKFGIAYADAVDTCLAAAASADLQLVALHVHVGSQVLSLDPMRASAARLAALAGTLAERGIALDYLDIGGGLGIAYDAGPSPSYGDYARTVLAEVQATGLPLVLEPGRTLVGPAGVLVTRVVDVKQQAGGPTFVVTDAGMTDLLRPALYGAFHRIDPVRRAVRPAQQVDVVGPVCESSDSFGTDRTLPAPAVDDLLVLRDAGAYGAVMASNYNRRTMPAEVLVRDGRWMLARRRQTIDDLLAWEP